jgi:hypothetical protein
VVTISLVKTPKSWTTVHEVKVVSTAVSTAVLAEGGDTVPEKGVGIQTLYKGTEAAVTKGPVIQVSAL